MDSQTLQLISATPRSMQTRPRGRKRWHRGFLAPYFIVLGLTAVVPLVFTAATSFGLFSGGTTATGDMSYLDLVQSVEFHNALFVQTVFVVGSVVLEAVLGTGIAFLVNRPGRLTSFVRGILLGPTLLPTIVVALLASFMLQGNVGVISLLLEPFGLEQAWLGSGGSALAVLVAVDVWQYAPFVAILVLAGLQGVPNETLEAAMVDGSGPWQTVRYIVLPQIWPAIVAASLLRFVDAIQVFPTIYVLTNGGPGTATSALNFWGFIEYFQLGHTQAGASAAIILAIATVVIAFALTKVLRPKGANS